MDSGKAGDARSAVKRRLGKPDLVRRDEILTKARVSSLFGQQCIGPRAARKISAASAQSSGFASRGAIFIWVARVGCSYWKGDHSKARGP